MTGFDQAQSPRLGQAAPIESTSVRIFDGEEIPEAAWPGQLIYRSDLQILQVYTDAEAWEDVIGGVAGQLTFVGSSAPVASNVGDLWYDTGNGNALNRWDGTAWILLPLGSEGIASGAIGMDELALSLQLRDELKVGDKITISNSDGFVASLNGDGEFRIPTDGSDPTITGNLKARRIEVENYLRILGSLNSVEGAMVLSGGVVAPKAAPIITNSWSHAQVSTTLDRAEHAGYRRSLTDDISGTQRVTASFMASSPRIMAHDMVTGQYINGVTLTYNLQPRGGVVRIGTYYFVLVRDTTGGTIEWWVRKYNYAFVYQNVTWKFIRGTTASEPTIFDTGGGFIGFARVTGTGRIEISQQTISGLDGGVLAQSVTSFVDPSTTLTGCVYDSADYGSPRYVITTQTSTYVFNASMAYQSGSAWSTINGEATLGIHYNGVQYEQLTDAGKFYKLSANKASVAKNWTYTWWDPVGTMHESPASPATSWTQKPREYVRVQTATPYYQGGPDDPKRVRIYATDSKQPDLADFQTVAVYNTIDAAGGNAPTAPYGGTITSGSIVSAAQDGSNVPYINLTGDGAVRLGELSMNTSGQTLKSPEKGGTVTITTGASGTVTSATVTFARPFATGVVPVITTDVVTSRPDINFSSHGGASNTGFTVYLTRNAASATLDVDWKAGVRE